MTAPIRMALLVVVAQHYPDENDQIVDAFRSLLPGLTDNGALLPGTDYSELWTWVALSLADLKDEASLPRIRALFRAEMIDEDAIGDEEQYVKYLYEQVDERPHSFDVLAVYEGLNEMAARRTEAKAEAAASTPSWTC